MRRDDGEFDYLAEAQLEINPASFRQVVKEAFLLERGLSRNQDIAAFLGVDKSRVSQIFKETQNLKPETIRMILAKVSRKEHRRRIARAWMAECFGEDVEDPRVGPVTGRNVTERTIGRVDRMIREGRLSLAAMTATEASRKAKEGELKERLLDRAYWARQRLDEPGRAMDVVRLIVEGARERMDPGREAAGHLFRARILVGLADCRPDEIEPVFDAAETLVGQVRKGAKEESLYAVGNERWLGSMRDSAEVIFMERGVKPKDHILLQAILYRALREARSSRSFQTRFGSWQTASRIYAMQGEHFKAQEALDRAFQAGGMKNLNAYERSSLISGRILLMTDGPEEAADYLREAADICRRQLDRYHLRLAEWDLARAVSRLM